MQNNDFKFNELLNLEMKHWNLSNMQVAEWIRLTATTISDFRRSKRPMHEAYYLLFKNTLIERVQNLATQKTIKIDNKIKRERIPIQKIVDLYHEKLPMLPTIRVLPHTTCTIIKTRWREDLKTLNDWEAYFNLVKNSDFLCGNSQVTWKADLEWLCRPTNFAKVMNQVYVNKK